MKKFLILLPLLFALPACTLAERKAAVNDVAVAAGAPSDNPTDVAVKVGTDLLSKSGDPAGQVTYLIQLAAAAAAGFAARHFGPKALPKKEEKV